MHRGKGDPGVSELPRGNGLSQDHVNRPKVLRFGSVLYKAEIQGFVTQAIVTISTGHVGLHITGAFTVVFP